ncbi:MAG: hypothetical protein P8X60_03795 [Robiginitalea sp.]|jgi:hypothetical protein
MAPIDFEKELRERIRSRKVKPDPQTWERLSSRLEEEGPAASLKPGRWIWMAAASVVLLMGILFLWKPVEELPAPDAVVESPVTTPVRVSEQINPLPSERYEAQLADTEIDKPEQEFAGGEVPEPTVSTTPVQIAEVSTSLQPETGGITPAKEPVEEKTAQSLAAAAPGDAPGENVRGDEIEALLKQAQDAIAMEKQQDSINTINAMVLLGLAEDELDQTFREKIMDKLKTGVDKFRTSVADRKK